MKGPCGCKRERPKRDRQSCVQCCGTRQVAQFKVLVPNVRRVGGAADRPRRQSPRAYVIGGHGEHSPDEEVHDTKEKRRANPRLTT